MIKININNEIDVYKTTLDFNSKFDKKTFIDKLKIVDTLVEASMPTKKHQVDNLHYPKCICLN